MQSKRGDIKLSINKFIPEKTKSFFPSAVKHICPFFLSQPSIQAVLTYYIYLLHLHELMLLSPDPNNLKK